jgi:hypothetical protein
VSDAFFLVKLYLYLLETYIELATIELWNEEVTTMTMMRGYPEGSTLLVQDGGSKKECQRACCIEDADAGSLGGPPVRLFSVGAAGWRGENRWVPIRSQVETPFPVG